jgi:hypothetical protein
MGARRGLVTPGPHHPGTVGEIIPEWWATSSGISIIIPALKVLRPVERMPACNVAIAELRSWRSESAGANYPSVLISANRRAELIYNRGRAGCSPGRQSSTARCAYRGSRSYRRQFRSAARLVRPHELQKRAERNCQREPESSIFSDRRNDYFDHQKQSNFAFVGKIVFFFMGGVSSSD